jgi:Fic family protein/DNA-binding XRE family transcriptional regulator
MTKFVMNYFVMKNLIQLSRKKKGYSIKEIANLSGIDAAIISKIESGKRLPTEKQLYLISQHLDIPYKELLILWMKQKMFDEIKNYEVAEEVVSLLHEDVVKYNISKRRIISNQIQDILNQIDRYKHLLDTKRKYDNYRIKEALELEYTFQSNRIEGNTLTLRETDLVINEGLTISGKSMREHLEAINHKEAIDYIYFLLKKNGVINEREVKKIHNLILRGIDTEQAGMYRKVQVIIKGSSFIPPNAFSIEDEMQHLFEWYEQHKQIHPVLLAAEMHERLVTIHPFIDGNGRISRLLMNLILLQHGYVIANLKGDSEARLNYYEALELAQTKDNKDDFIALIAQSELDCIKRYVSLLG